MLTQGFQPYCLFPAEPKPSIRNMNNVYCPKISLVTPSFNQGQFIEKTIQSVLSQGYSNLEYVVIDGGSSDNSVDIIRKYGDQLAYWTSAPDGGHGAGLNKGFAQTSGEIMGWINSDDMLTQWSLATVAEIFTKFPHVNWIHGINSWWNRKGQMIGAAKNHVNIYDYLTGNYAWIQQESVFWRRSLWEKAGGSISTHYQYMIDSELWSRFFLNDQLYTLDCVLSGYRSYQDTRASMNYAACLAEMDAILSEMASQCDDRVKRNARLLQAIFSLSKLPPFANTLGTAKARRMIRKLIGLTVSSHFFKAAQYKAITWDIATNDWIETVRPFGI